MVRFHSCIGSPVTYSYRSIFCSSSLVPVRTSPLPSILRIYHKPYLTSVIRHRSTTTAIPPTITKQSKPCINWLLAIDSTHALPSSSPIVVSPGWHEYCSIETTPVASSDVSTSSKPKSVSSSTPTTKYPTEYRYDVHELDEEECIHIVVENTEEFVTQQHESIVYSPVITKIFTPQMMDIDIRTHYQPVSILGKMEGNCFIETTGSSSSNVTSSTSSSTVPTIPCSNIDIHSTLRGTQIELRNNDTSPTSFSPSMFPSKNITPSSSSSSLFGRLNIHKVLETGTGTINTNYLYARKLLADTLLINIYNNYGKLESIYCKNLTLNQFLSSNLEQLFIGSLHGYGKINLFKNNTPTDKQPNNTIFVSSPSSSSLMNNNTSASVASSSTSSSLSPIVIRQITGTLDYQDNFILSTTKEFSSSSLLPSIIIQYDSPRGESSVRSLNSIDCTFVSSTNTATTENTKQIQTLLASTNLPVPETAAILSAVRLKIEGKAIHIPSVTYDSNNNVVSNFFKFNRATENSQENSGQSSSASSSSSRSIEGILLLYDTAKSAAASSSTNVPAKDVSGSGSGKIRDTINVTGWYMSEANNNSATKSPSTDLSSVRFEDDSLTGKLAVLPLVYLSSEQTVHVTTYSWYDIIRKQIDGSK